MEKFYIAWGDAATPVAKAARRSCMEIAGISPSTYKTRRALGACQLNGENPLATALQTRPLRLITFKTRGGMLQKHKYRVRHTKNEFFKKGVFHEKSQATTRVI